MTPLPRSRASIYVPAPKGNSGLGIAALVMGIAACLVCWIPFIGMVAFPLGVVGGLLALIGFVMALFSRTTSIGMPLSGGIVCLVAIGIAAVVTGGTTAAVAAGTAAAVDSVGNREAVAPVTSIAPIASVIDSEQAGNDILAYDGEELSSSDIDATVLYRDAKAALTAFKLEHRQLAEFLRASEMVRIYESNKSAAGITAALERERAILATLPEFTEAEIEFYHAEKKRLEEAVKAFKVAD